MTPEERKAAIELLKEICREIGCSGLNPDMCNNRPHLCGIIRKLLWLEKNAVQPSDAVLRACEHKNMRPSEPHGYLYCPDCGLRH